MTCVSVDMGPSPSALGFRLRANGVDRVFDDLVCVSHASATTGMAAVRNVARQRMPAQAIDHGVDVISPEQASTSPWLLFAKEEHLHSSRSGAAPMIIVLLAAGAASRMGRQKLLLPVDGQPIIERVLHAAAAWPIVVVAGDEVAWSLGSTPLCIVRNASPQRGMAHSLALANQAIPDNEPIAVLLADNPDVTAATIADVIAAYDESVDIVIPRHGQTSAHPVIFGPRARRKIPELADGDTIKRLRDDPSLRRRVIEVSAEEYVDIDTPADYIGRIGSDNKTVESSR